MAVFSVAADVLLRAADCGECSLGPRQCKGSGNIDCFCEARGAAEEALANSLCRRQEKPHKCRGPEGKAKNKLTRYSVIWLNLGPPASPSLAVLVLRTVCVLEK